MSWEMDFDGESSGALREMDELENYAQEIESCGICRDIVIERGVLDCCQHWFCYTCIDNWAAITNRCPLCKCEFQHITCTPVYDTTGATNEDEYSLTSGDDDWYMQGESSALSFPSYYIDAEAVVCLNGGGCKIRNGLVAAEDDSNLDTSIACDSCDIWYHAICVSFNPETASESSWLCPRCVSSEVKHKESIILKQNFGEECVTGSDGTSADASFSGRVSVSVADEGETALVVSMVGAHSETRDGLGLMRKHEAFDCSSYPSYSKDDFTDIVADPNILSNTDNLTITHNKSSEKSIVCTTSEPPERPLEFSPIRESSTSLFSSELGRMPSELLEVPNLVASCSLVDNSNEAENTGEGNAAHNNKHQRSSVYKPTQPSSPAWKMVRYTDIDMSDEDAVLQLKTTKDMQLPPRHGGHRSSGVKENNDVESGDEINHPVKKAKLEMQEQDMNLVGKYGVSSIKRHTTASSPKATTSSDASELLLQHKSVPDIMSIVGEDYRRDPGREQAEPVGRRAGDKPGLRVKKIFRKEGKEASVVVQKLQQEIREVVRDTGTNILEKDGCFDEKLLTAFRAAIGKSVDGPAKNTNHSLIRTKRSLLQKGKKRENLTKKLYGTTTGRRRSAWHRDWEVEFWKYRCSPGINPDKIETLQSVLQLLKKSSEMDKQSAQGNKGEDNNSIFSRLYLADTSIIPRKDDIKPLSALAGCSPSDKITQAKANNNKSPNIPVAGTETIKIGSSSSTGKVSNPSILKKEASSGRENINNQPTQNQKTQSSGDIKQDKRKWALEILARKSASSVTDKDQSGDTDALKANFPLLAQLPVDMRPQLAAGRNNKVPTSVRQAQLHRIAEHYLQKANLDVIRRCADTELAIADAINVEKDIYERSNRKSIYVNLCAQATRRPAKEKSENGTSTLTEKIELPCDLIPQQLTPKDTNISGSDVKEALNMAVVSIQNSELHNDIAKEQIMHRHTVAFSSAEEALRKAGLFDSPPNSPERKTAETEANDVSSLKDDKLSEPNEADVVHCPNLCTLMSSQQPKTNSEEQKLTACEENKDAKANETSAMSLAGDDRCSANCEKSSGPVEELSAAGNMPDKDSEHVENSGGMEITGSSLPNLSPRGNGLPSKDELISKIENLEPSKEKYISNNPTLNNKHPEGEKPTHPAEGADSSKKPAPDQARKNPSDSSSSVYKKVEMFVKEHIRPLCKSGVITVDQYRWAVTKTTDKVMTFHRDAKNASFLIKEGDKVKRLALQYVEAAQQKVN